MTNELQRTIIVKLQGSAAVGGMPESYVVTEDDHLLHLSRDRSRPAPDPRQDGPEPVRAPRLPAA